MLLENVWLNGSRWDLRVRGGRFTQANRRSGPENPDVLIPEEGEWIRRGGLICPHFAEPHVHLDATQLGRRYPNREGTLTAGIAIWARAREELTHKDVRDRALTTIRWYLAQGTTRIRTHVDPAGMPAVETLLSLREELAGGVPGMLTASEDDGRLIPAPIELQVVAFPQEGILRAPGRRSRWEEVVAMGCDAVGAIPHFERTTEEGWTSVRLAFELAERWGLRVDLHCDETDDPGSRNLEVVCAEALDRGFGDRVVAGHCTALHSYPNPYAAKIIDLVAESGVQVVTNPLDNVVLQGRFDGYPKRRGLTRVDELWQAGACVGIGHDSIIDPWYRLGTANMLDAANMLLHVGQLTTESQMEQVLATLSDANHRPFGRLPSIKEGEVADFLWFPADDPIEVLRRRCRPEVFIGGRRLVVPEMVESAIG